MRFKDTSSIQLSREDTTCFEFRVTLHKALEIVSDLVIRNSLDKSED